MAVFFATETGSPPNSIKKIAEGVWFWEGDMKQGHSNSTIIEMKSGARLAPADAKGLRRSRGNTFSSRTTTAMTITEARSGRRGSDYFCRAQARWAGISEADLRQIAVCPQGLYARSAVLFPGLGAYWRRWFAWLPELEDPPHGGCVHLRPV